eukprot:Cvel_27780.t3-p1 / transcript=Cvel_27780.t3 / gene=Cvel_27780 / organism=Chromera_velia_CCMP2878 / gene_product=L-arabinokinase, putative / transcript_product=L-arabinokinase, putative / location=Cvel_scaffold3524:1347-2391(+) / protein_length=348 / sequence_SO=supercontig / SO=protein_coding / is_pseudo=false
MKAVYYVSGHGFGHASRSAEVGRHLAQQGGFSLVFRTQAAEKIFSETLESYQIPFEYSRLDHPVDVGAVQPSPFIVDAGETLKAYVEKIYSRFDELLQVEEKYLRESGASIVLSDASGLPLEAAKKVGIPSVVVSNFLWSSIYQHILELYYGPDGQFDDSSRQALEKTVGVSSETELRESLKRLEKAYANADLLISLPGLTPNREIPPSKMLDAGWVYRPLRQPREKLRPRLFEALRMHKGQKTFASAESIAPPSRLILVTFGGQTTGDEPLVTADNEALRAQGAAVIWGGRPPEGSSEEADGLGGSEVYLWHLRPGDVSEYMPDVVASVDVVVGKIGYGTLSECRAA